MSFQLYEEAIHDTQMQIRSNFFQDLYFQGKQKKPGSELREDMEVREKAAGDGMVQELPSRGTVLGETQLRHQNLA